MNRKVLCALMLIILLSFSCLTIAGAKTYDPVHASITVSPTTVNSLATINVSITISNVGDGDMVDPVTLYAPNGKVVSDFGTNGEIILSIGSSRTYEGKWTLRQSDVDKGKISYFITYPVYNEDGTKEPVTRYLSKNITFSNAVTDMQINRTVTPSIAKEGQEVLVTYDFTNNGTVSATDILIEENKSISTKTGKIAKIMPGDSEQYEFKVTMGKKNITSSSTVSYTTDGDKKEETFDALTVTYGDSQLKAEFSSNVKGVTTGETATITLLLTNSGNVDYENLTISDPTLGELFTNQAVPAGETLELTKDVVLNEPGEFQYTITGNDSTGEEYSNQTDKISIGCVDVTKKIHLNVVASSDKSEVYDIPGKVRFKVEVSNDSLSDAQDVGVYHGKIKIYTFDLIAPGQTKTIHRDASLKMSGKYQFTAKTTDVTGDEISFSSNEIPIIVSNATMVPVTMAPPTPQPLVTERLKTRADAPDNHSSAQSIIGSAYTIFTAITGVLLLLLIASIVMRLRLKLEAKSSIAKIAEISKNRDYKEKKDRITIEKVGKDNRFSRSNESNFYEEDPYQSPYADEIPEIEVDDYPIAPFDDYEQPNLYSDYEEDPTLDEQSPDITPDPAQRNITGEDDIDPRSL